MEPLRSEIERIVASAGRPRADGEDVLRERFKDRLRQRLGDDRYGMWFRGKATFRWDAEIITVGVPSRYHAEWMEGHFAADVAAAARDAMGIPLRVRVRVDPTLFAGPSVPIETTPPPLAPPAKPRLLFDVAPLPEIFARDGRDHLLVSLSGKGPWTVRAVGELFRAWIHYGADIGGSRLCFGRKCIFCGDGRKRARVGYFDGIRLGDVGLFDGQEVCIRVVQGIPEGAAERLRIQGGTMRGKLYLFTKVSTVLTRVKVIEESCQYTLAEPIDVSLPVGRRYSVNKFPDQERELEEEPKP